MKVFIIYFSGTGNTKSIAQGYERALKKQGHTPHELIQWVRRHIPPVTGNKKALVYSTSAGLKMPMALNPSPKS
ncbi:MAG: hypothetical protein SCK57_10755 [Bacillota bacterium]|nr:hypothetical protein [Bacillota bacterium]